MGRIVRWQQFYSGDGKPVAVVQVDQPVRAPQFIADFAVPLAKAAAIGLIGGSFVALALWHWQGWSWWITWGLCVLGLSAGQLLLKISESSDTLFRTEALTMEDLQASLPAKDAPPALSDMIINPLEAQREIGQTQAEVERGVRQDKLIDFYRKCLTVGTSEGAHGVSGTAARQEYVEQRDTLFRLGLAGRTGTARNSGWELKATMGKAQMIIRKHLA